MHTESIATVSVLTVASSVSFSAFSFFVCFRIWFACLTCHSSESKRKLPEARVGLDFPENLDNRLCLIVSYPIPTVSANFEVIEL